MAELQKLLPRRSFIAAMAGASGMAILPSSLQADISPAATPPTPAGLPHRPVPLLSTYVAGAAQYAAPAVVSTLRSGDALMLVRHPGNTYDPRAVEVRTAQGQLIGYVPRAENQALCNLMDAGLSTTARVYQAVADPEHPQIRFNVELLLRA